MLVLFQVTNKFDDSFENYMDHAYNPHLDSMHRFNYRMLSYVREIFNFRYWNSCFRFPFFRVHTHPLMPARPMARVSWANSQYRPHQWKPNSRKVRLLFNYSIDFEFSYSAMPTAATVADYYSFNRIELMNQTLSKQPQSDSKSKIGPTRFAFRRGKCLKFNDDALA